MADADGVFINGKADFNVADSAGGSFNFLHHVFAAIGADAGRPRWRGSFANLAPPLRTGLGKIIGEDVVGTFAIGAVDDGDIEMRENLAGIEFLKLRVVPALDRSEEDFGEDGAREAKVSPDARNVINR